jgi:hypothetical protein
VANSLPLFAVEHELCSANLPGKPQVAESAIDQALEALHLRGTTAAAEKTSDEPTSPVAMEPPAIPTWPAESKSRKLTRSATKRPHLKSSRRLFEAFRSRRRRIIATAVVLLIVLGLIGFNWQRSGRPLESDELAELDLAEFQDDLHFGTTAVGRASEPRPLGEITGADAAALRIQSSRSNLAERLLPIGFVNHSEQRWPSAGIQTIEGFSKPATRGSQAAWLTGQIEIEPLGTQVGDSLRPTNGRDIAR